MVEVVVRDCKSGGLFACHLSFISSNTSKIMDEKMSLTVADAVDYKGHPADKSRTGGWVPAALSLGIEICERLSTMGIAVNLVTYLGGTMHLPSATSANVVTDFMGTSFLLCLLGGFLADSYLGRYRTIAIFAMVQMLGTCLLAVSTKLPQLRPPPCKYTNVTQCEQANSFQMGILYLSLYLIALGTGGLKSSVSGFGTDQFDEKNEKEKAQMAYFFNRFFFVISTGTLMAVTVLVYIQDEVGRSWGYGICSASMFIALMIFFSGTKRYRYKKCSGSPIVHICQVVSAASGKKTAKLPSDISLLYEDLPEASRIHHTDQFRFLDKASVVTEDDYRQGSFMMNPWKLCAVTRVEEVKKMIRLLPIWATTIIFWTTYAQMITFSVEQATTMERTIGHFQIPAGSLTVFFVGAILISLAVYDRFIIPLCKKWRGEPGFTNLQLIGIGLFLSAMGMAAAAVVEVKRLSVAKKYNETTTLPITVFYLIPQFFLVGARRRIYIHCLLVSIVKATTGSSDKQGWLGEHINKGRLDCFYGLLAALSFFNFGLFLLSAAWFRKKTVKQAPETEIIVKESTIEEKC
ncbi:hypothetical protein GOBAR_DD31288 [Gossypium barbadense]|nr:hypothetical protein GOBAR_DD31288 [Gossypium barbadense]